VKREPWTLALGEYAAGVLSAIATAAAIHGLIDPRWDMVLAMLTGLGVGGAIHVVAGVACTPWVGMFPAMASGSLIGMYGGMLFAMRDSMEQASWTQALGVAALFGVLVVAGVRFYDRALRGARLSGDLSERASAAPSSASARGPGEPAPHR
jgi:hypothetical protein